MRRWEAVAKSQRDVKSVGVVGVQLVAYGGARGMEGWEQVGAMRSMSSRAGGEGLGEVRRVRARERHVEHVADMDGQIMRGRRGRLTDHEGQI